MYVFDQIIYDKDNKRPHIIHDVWDITEYPKRHTHFVARDGSIWTGPQRFQDDAAEEEWLRKAAEMLERGEIVPAQTLETHCPDCGNWLTNPPRDWCEDQKHRDTFAASCAKRAAR
jgi:hypothetical protein